MNGSTVLLFAIMSVQLYMTFDQVLLLMAADSWNSHIHLLSTNIVGSISALVTAVYTARLRHIQHSLSHVEQSLQIKDDNRGQRTDVVVVGQWSIGYRTRGLLALAVIVYNYLMYSMMVEYAQQTARQSALLTLLCTISLTGNYYVTFMFVDHVFYAKRSVI